MYLLPYILALSISRYLYACFLIDGSLHDISRKHVYSSICSYINSWWTERFRFCDLKKECGTIYQNVIWIQIPSQINDFQWFWKTEYIETVETISFFNIDFQTRWTSAAIYSLKVPKDRYGEPYSRLTLLIWFDFSVPMKSNFGNFFQFCRRW